MGPFNILLLGQTGVGKSTWINSLLNYLTFQSLKEAMLYEPLYAIPVKFSINGQEIILGENDENEVGEAGQSATQYPKTYTFTTPENSVIRIIDTPGIGDVRGIKRDDENMQTILNHLSTLNEVHCICILLKANESKIHLYFRFCIKQLLTHLHKSAVKNIVFCFTNSRGSFYGPGDTEATLEAILKNLRIPELKLSESTKYCFDNEAFRFLCMLKSGYKVLDEFELVSYERSWTVSQECIKRLLKHMAVMTPHSIKDTTTLCEIRFIVTNLSEPTIEITKAIDMNVEKIKKKKEKLEKKRMENVLIEKYAIIKKYKVILKELHSPKIVCSCKAYVNIINETHVYHKYERVCCEKCTEINIFSPYVSPDPKIKKCSHFKGLFSVKCDVCHCSWNKHKILLLDYEFEVVEEVDPRIKSIIDNNHMKYDQINQVINELQKQVDNYMHEKNTIVKASVKFRTFLEKHSLVLYNDTLVAYIETLIKEEEEGRPTKRTKESETVLLGLKETLNKYKSELQLLKQIQSSTASITTVDVMEEIRKLYDLPMIGKMLKKCAEASRQFFLRNAEHNEEKICLRKGLKLKI